MFEKFLNQIPILRFELTFPPLQQMQTESVKGQGCKLFIWNDIENNLRKKTEKTPARSRTEINHLLLQS